MKKKKNKKPKQEQPVSIEQEAKKELAMNLDEEPKTDGPQEDLQNQPDKKSRTAKNEKKPEMAKPREGLGQELIEVYEASGDDLTSVTSLEHRRRSWQKMLIWILAFLVLVFAGVAVISWLIWGGRQQFSGDQVEFDVDVIEEIHSGDMLTYRIDYANHESVNFRKSELELRYPAGFIFESADPAPTSAENLWDLGSLDPGQKDSIEVTGRLVGNPDTDSTLSAVLRYWPANFSSEFQEVASAQTKIKPLDLNLRFDGPNQVLVGQPTAYSLVLQNETDNEISNVRLSFLAPDDFIIEEALPELLDDKNYWDIETISPDEELEFQLDGYFATMPEAEVDIIALLSQQGPDEDTYFDQKEAKLETRLIEGDLVVNLIANGSNRDTSVQWGDRVNMTIAYENSSETNLSDLTVIAKLETRYRTQNAENTSNGAIDFDSLVDTNRAAMKILDGIDEKSVHVRSLTWTEDDIAELSQLEPEEEGEINLQFSVLDIKQALQELNHPEDAELVLTTEVVVGQTGSVQEEVTVSSNQIVIKLDTDLTFDAYARYYSDSGEQVGSGPLPPVIGEATQYQVVWELTNQIHEPQEIIVSTELPSNVDWINDYEVSAGEVSYNASNSELTWRLNKIPLDISQVVLRFKISLTPLDTQEGSVANITKKMTMTAKDSVTGGSIIQSVSALDTGVERDDKASDKGLVVK